MAAILARLCRGVFPDAGNGRFAHGPHRRTGCCQCHEFVNKPSRVVGLNRFFSYDDILVCREALHHERLTEAINPFNEPFLQAYDAATESGLELLAFAAQVQSEITRQGYILCFVELFQCFALVCFVFALVIWLADSPGRLTAKSA